MATASDNFDRADAANLGANWGTISAENTHGIKANAADEVDTFAEGSLWTNDAFDDDQFSEVTFSTLSDFIQSAVVRGSTTARTYYRAGFDANDFNGDRRIAKYVDGGLTSLATEAVAIVASDKVKLEASGDGLEMFVNDVSELTTTDPDIASGRPGINSLSDPNIDIGRFDEWSGGDSAAPEVPAARPAWNYRHYA